jgi:excisionase family DNA binding protein
MVATVLATNQLMTRSEAAEALALSVRMIDELVKSGDLPTVRIGRSVRFRPSALEYFVEARESRMNPRKKGGR